MAIVTFEDLPSTNTPLNAANLNNNFNYTVPAGGIMEFAGSTAPTGWLICDGQAVSRTTYADLYAIIGTTYGTGDGSTTFNVPNLKGKVPVGRNSSDTSFDTLGETGGEKTHTLTINEMPKHGHNYMVEETDGDTFGTLRNVGAWNKANSSWAWTKDRGGDQPHNNLQPYIVLNYIIKY